MSLVTAHLLLSWEQVNPPGSGPLNCLPGHPVCSNLDFDGPLAFDPTPSGVCSSTFRNPHTPAVVSCNPAQASDWFHSRWGVWMGCTGGFTIKIVDYGSPTFNGCFNLRELFFPGPGPVNGVSYDLAPGVTIFTNGHYKRCEPVVAQVAFTW